MSKNYLFAPFKNDDDKIAEFNAVVNSLKYVLADVVPSLTDTDKNHYMESALHGLRVFIGRLESYYDVIVSELQAESIEQIKDNKRLKAENDNDINVSYELDDKHIEIISDLEAENDKLKAEIKKLQNTINNDDADYNSLDGQYNKLENENESLKEEIESLQDQLKNAVNDYELLLNSNGVK